MDYVCTHVIGAKTLNTSVLPSVTELPASHLLIPLAPGFQEPAQ